MDDFGELVELDVRLYRAALHAPASTLVALGAALAEPVDVLDKPMARLADMGLLNVDDADLVTAVSPMLAEAVVLGAEDLELGARRAAVEHRRNAIRALVPTWNEVLSAVVETSVDLITDPAAIANVLMHHADRCRDELLSVAPGRLPPTRIDGRARVANMYSPRMYSARCGDKTRALYQQAALRDRATRAHLFELAGTGARIRLAPSLPGRSLVVDRTVALLPTPTDDLGRQGLAVVHEPNVIAWVVATFEQVWAEAVPLEDMITRPAPVDAHFDDTRAAILRLLADGEKDEAISRRLSISVRTCRRHIADYMSQVGATSRFQAGVIFVRSGHVDSR